MPRSTAFLFSLVVLSLAVPWAPPARAEDWKEVSRNPELTVSTRVRAGSPIAEVRAVGRIEASPTVVKGALDDRENYPKFMPYVAETRVLAGGPGARTIVSYMRLTPPLVSPRDYTILVHDEPRRTPEGVVYFNHWELANDKGPPEKPGVARVKLSEGSWLLEPENHGASTRATYTLFTDGGGNLPAFAVNLANKRSLAALFTAVRQAARDPRYRQSRPLQP